MSSDGCSWFHDYLSDRTQAIVIDGVKSEFPDVHKGVPQRAFLGQFFPLTIYMYTPLVNLHFLYSAFGKVFRQLHFFHILLRYSIILKWM